MVPLLSCRIPDFELDGGFVEADGLGQEGRADGAVLEVKKLPFDKTEHEGTLAHAGLSKENQFELEDLLLCCHSSLTSL